MSANFSQTQKVRLLGFRKFQVFSPNRGDAQLFRKMVKNIQVRLLRKLICTTFAKPKKLGFSDFENSKFSRQIGAMRNFFEKWSKITRLDFGAN